MQKLKFIMLFIILACLSLAGCSKSDTKVDANRIIKSSATIVSEKLEEDKNADAFTLTVWNSSIDKKYIEKLFKEIYPKAKVNVINVDWADSDKIIKVLASSDAPDVVINYSEKFGNLNALDGFEDLLQSKYNFEDIKSIFSKRELDESMSFDGKKLIALPFTAAPMVTYYRSDILEKYGMPTDPNELGDFMEKPEGWLAIAKSLKKDDKWALQWKDEFVYLAVKESGYFDKDMKLKVDDEKVKNAVKIAKETDDLGLIGNYNIDTEEGKKAVREGKIAMLYLNKYGEDSIKMFAPETAGKWRATRLPLGMYSYSSTNNISITSSSKYKMQGWVLVKKLIEEDRNYYASIRNQENEFLGGQKSKLLYENLISKLPRRYPTMLDDKVYSIFNESTKNYLNSNIAVENILDSTKLKINNSIYHEQKALSVYIKENRKH